MTLADISLNKPFTIVATDFFRRRPIPIGNARTITSMLTPQSGGDAVTVNIAAKRLRHAAGRNESRICRFSARFYIQRSKASRTRVQRDYNNPAAVLNVTPPGGEKTRVFAFAGKLADNIPVGAPKAGYKWRLVGI